MHRVIVILLFLIVSAAVLIPGALRQRRGAEVIGKPPINKWLFFKAKALMIASWAFMLVQATGVDLHSIEISESLLWFATFLLFVGVMLVSVSLLHLGESTRMGLPTNTTALKTHGLYRFSRNPLYVGAYLIGVASCLYCPNVINFLVTIGFIVLHHHIIIGEEKFLSGQFGEEWVAYGKKVRRYL